MLVQAFIALDILLFLDALSNDLATFLVYLGHKIVSSASFLIGSFTSTLSFELLDGLLVEWVFPVFGDRGGWLLSFLQDALAVLASLGLELALCLDLTLDFALLELYVFLLTVEVFRHTLLPRFESSYHFFRLTTHRLWLERTPGCLFEYPLFLEVDYFFAWLLGLP